MIKKLLTLSFTFALIFGLHAQITVDNSTFPKPGDTLSTITDFLPEGIEIGEAGPERTWDFTSLEGPFVSQEIYLPAWEGEAAEDFQNADMVAKGADNQEVYYHIFDDKIEEVGRAGVDPVLGIINSAFQYIERPIFRRAPMAYEDTLDFNASFIIALSTDVIPDSLIPGIEFIDSIRIETEFTSETEIDAWGTLELPTESFSVLREKVVTTSNTSVFAKSFFGWTELTPELLGEFGSFLEESITTTYNFYNDGEKEIIASAFVDEEGILRSVEYINDKTISSIKVLGPSDKEIVVFPNPTFGDVNFKFVNMPMDHYKIEVYNIIGKKLWEDSWHTKNGSIFSADISHLSKGTYIYSIINNEGRKVSTKRVMIINP